VFSASVCPFLVLLLLVIIINYLARIYASAEYLIYFMGQLGSVRAFGYISAASELDLDEIWSTLSTLLGSSISMKFGT